MHPLAAMACAAAIALTGVPAASASVFTNAAPITIPSSGPANPYPSTIEVQGLEGQIKALGPVVTLHSINHTFPRDLDIVLAGPDPTGFGWLLSDTCGDSGDAFVQTTLTIDDTSGRYSSFGGPCPSGTYHSHDQFEDAPDQMPAPSPTPSPFFPRREFGEALTGTNPNGTWKLFVFDDKALLFGAIQGGWTLEFQTTASCGTTGPASITGTAGDDLLEGTERSDVIVGFGGNDTIRGNGGFDVLCGRGGNDSVDGGPGFDNVYGEAGKDKLKGGADDDSLYGGAGKDKLKGQAGRDELLGAGGRDSCAGGGGSDSGRSCEKAKSL